MTREDIQLALRLVAHGRVNHPQVEELAEKLAGLFAGNAPTEPPPDTEDNRIAAHVERRRAARSKKAE